MIEKELMGRLQENPTVAFLILYFIFFFKCAWMIERRKLLVMVIMHKIKEGYKEFRI